MPVLGATADCSPYFVALQWRFRIVLGKLVRALFALYGLPKSVPPAGERSETGRGTRCPTRGRGTAYGAGCLSIFKPAMIDARQDCRVLAGEFGLMSDASPCSYGGLRFVFAGSYVNPSRPPCP
jgi:hypothetical protein